MYYVPHIINQTVRTGELYYLNLWPTNKRAYDYIGYASPALCIIAPQKQ